MQVKISFILVALLVVFCSGCVSTKRGMLSENVYYSEKYPDVKVAVDPDFSYSKGSSEQYDHMFEGPYGKRFFAIHHETFAVLDNKLDYWEHPHHWIFSGIPRDNIVNKGEVELLSQTWYTASTFEKKDKGCLLGKHLRRFTDEQSFFAMVYLIWRPDSYCEDMENASNDNSEGQLVFNEVENDFKETVHVTQYSTEN